MSTDVAIPSRQARAVSTVEGRAQRRQLVARLEERLGIGSPEVGERVEHPAVLDRGQDVVELAVVRGRVVDVVGDDDRQPELRGERHRFRDEPVVVGQQVVRELDEEAARRRSVATPEDRGVELRHRPGARPIADPQPASDLPVATTRQRDDALVLLLEQRVAEPRHGLGPGQVRARDEPAQAAPADRAARQQHEVRTACPLADPAHVLLDRIAMPGQLRALGSRAGRSALHDRRLARRGVGSAASGPTPWRDHDRGGIRHRRVAQLDLRPDDPVQSCLLGGAHEPDGSVQAVAVRDSQPGQALGDGSLDQIVGRRSPVQERKIGMGMELGVWDDRHGGRSGRGAGGGPASIEQMFGSE